MADVRMSKPVERQGADGPHTRPRNSGRSESGAEAGNYRSVKSALDATGQSDKMQRVLARLASAESLLVTEERVRQAEDENELVHLIANETRKLLGARQVIVFRRVAAERYDVRAISSVAVVDRDTPFIRWIEGVVRALEQRNATGKRTVFALSDYADEADYEAAHYPFKSLCWQPLQLRSGERFAGILVAREREWTEQDCHALEREAGVFSLIWQGLGGGADKLRKLRRRRPLLKPLLVALGLLAAVFPVPMTTLAPVEIVAKDPHRVTAPIDGVVQAVPVPPNSQVLPGQVILKLDDTTLRNQLNVANQQLNVAAARYDRARQAAFSDPNARHELAIAENEYRLKQAERDYAADQLARTVVTAKRSGVLVYADRDKLLGRPVKIGERLMQIADPRDIAARIELPVADAIVLADEARVKLFLDADPLSSISAHLKSKAYHAEPNSTQQLVYRLIAEFGDQRLHTRIGARGTAQLQGDTVPLAYFLLRRPIAAVRQYIGL